jgi:phage replication initiation protein
MDVMAKGAYITVTGQGCRELEGEGVVTNWQAFCLNLWAVGFEAVRFDVAFDDRTGILPFAEIQERVEGAARDWESRSFTTRAKSVGGQWSGGQDKDFGYTLGFGVRGSETYVRMYDKAAQQGVSDAWIRCELEFRRERASAAIAMLGNEGLRGIAGVLRSHLDFKCDRESRLGAAVTRLKRKTTVGWWLSFLDGCDKAQLAIKPVVRSVERSLDWIQKQVAPALAMILSAKGYGWESVAGLALAGIPRLRKCHREMLRCHESNFARGLARVKPSFVAASVGGGSLVAV